MKKGAIFLVLVLSFIIGILIINSVQNVLAYETEDTAIPQAYKWLINHTKNKWNSLSIKQDALSLLALQCNSTYVSQGNRSLLNMSYYSPNSSSGKIRCWKESGKATSSSQCRLTETALAKLALSEVDYNISAVDNWILSNKRAFTNNIYWFLQIDVARGKEASCEIMYNNKMQNVTVHDDKKVSIYASVGTGDCIEGVFRDYWFKIKQTEECYTNEYLIKCFGNESTADPVTANLLYRNNTNDPRTSFFVSSEISQGTLGFINQLGEEEQTPGIMQLNTPSYCLGNPSDPPGICDYEGTAWAVYTWNKEGNMENVNNFLPYLVVYSSFNEKYFPETFLSKFVGNEYTEKVLKELQRIRKPQSTDYWSFWLNQPLLYGEFYDTPLAVLNLGASASSIDENKDYLLGHLSKDYSWVNTFDAAPGKDTHRDTAFVLWVFWPDYCPGYSGGGQGNDCESKGIGYQCKESCNLNELVWEMFDCPDELVCCYGENWTQQDECVARGGECMNVTSCPEGYGSINDVLCTSEKPLCCDEFSTSQCSDWQGNICEIGYECPANYSINTIDGECCLTDCIEQGGSNSCSSYEINGEICEEDEDCWSYVLEDIVSWTPALEERCCSASCVKKESCSDIGKDCSSGSYGSGYNCLDSSGGIGETEKTKETEECCLDDCKKGCTASKTCSSDQVCEGDRYDNEAITPAGTRCCLNDCKDKPPKSPWVLIIIVIVVLAVLILVYFFFIKKKKKEEEGFDEFTGFPKETKTDEKFGKGKDDFGIADFGAFPKNVKEAPEKMNQQGQRQAPKPLFSRQVAQPTNNSSTSSSKKTIVKETITKKEVKPRPSQANQTKAEKELEETLGKLKRLTKR